MVDLLLKAGFKKSGVNFVRGKQYKAVLSKNGTTLYLSRYSPNTGRLFHTTKYSNYSSLERDLKTNGLLEESEKFLELRIKKLENILLKESRFELDSIELVCGFKDARLIPEILRDTRIDRKLGFRIIATSTTSWDIELNEYEGTAKELIDELTEVFNEYGCDDFEFKY